MRRVVLKHKTQFPRNQVKLVMVGLKGAGKATLVKRWMSSGVKEVIDGFVVKQFEWNNINLTVFDVGGEGQERSVWEEYLKDADAVFYVVDSCDKNSLELNKQELHFLLEHPLLKKSAFMVMANKQV